MRRIVITLLFFCGLVLSGTSGYMLIEGSSFFDSLYMTFITITTVGYGEIFHLSTAGRVFTMLLILFGMGFVLFLLGEITEAVVEGGLKKLYGRYKMEKRIAGMRGHYIICGYGRIGKVICEILAENRRPFVVVETNPKEIQAIRERNFPYIDGEATVDEVLLRAGIKHARALVASVSSDADNVYIILSARGLKPDLFILARASADKNAETKLLRAGASKVISPYFIGATRMAHVLVRPAVTDFIDLTVHGGELGLRLEELLVSPDASCVNLPLQESGLRQRFDLIVVAIKREAGEMLFNPTPQTMILPRDTLIVLGHVENIKILEKEL